MMESEFPSELEDAIYFHSEAIEFELADAEKITTWLKQIIQQEGQQLHTLNFIFCSDQYLHQINVAYLDHDTYTDVITFPYSDAHIEGDIFISLDRIKENATTFKVNFLNELQRVIAHGVLHLCGYGDKTETEQQLMRQKETASLALLFDLV